MLPTATTNPNGLFDMSKAASSVNLQSSEMSAKISLSEANARIAEANARTQIANANSLEAQVRFEKAKKELENLRLTK